MSKTKEALGRIRDLPDDELKQAHDRAREELFRLRLGNYTNQVENTISIRHKRRELARILTVQRARSLTLESQAAPSAPKAPKAAAAKTEKAPKAAAKPAKAEKAEKAPKKAKKGSKE
jgi:large subunit ribosomal protein L29